jgi:hypothetical protein
MAVVGDWRRLHNEELQNLYASPNVVRVTKSRNFRMVGYVACMGEMINAYKILAGEPEGKRLLGRLRHRWDDNIRLDVWEIGWDVVD